MSSPSEGPDGPAKVDKARLHGTATVRSATKEMRGLREQHLAVDREHVPDVTASPKASVEQYINAFAPIVGCTARMRRCRQPVPGLSTSRHRRRCAATITRRNSAAIPSDRMNVIGPPVRAGVPVEATRSGSRGG
jgi:hypothetical protein